MHISSSPISQLQCGISPQHSSKSNLSSKVFFKNIKAQLSSIRTDIHNMVSTTRKNNQTPISQKNQITLSPKFSLGKNTYLHQSKISQKGNHESYQNTPQKVYAPLTRSNKRQNIGSKEPRDKVGLKYYQQKEVSKDMMETQTSNFTTKNNMNIVELPGNVKAVNNIVKTQRLFNKELNNTQDLQKMTFIRLQNSMDTLKEQYKEQQEKNLRQLAKYKHEIAQSMQSLQAKDVMINTLNKQKENLRQSHLKQLEGKNEKIKELELQRNRYIRLYEEAIRNTEITQIKQQQEQPELKSESQHKKNDFKELGKEYENRINALFDQNCNMKNKIVHFQNEGKLAKFKINSLEAIIQAHQESNELSRINNTSGVIAQMKNQINKLHTQINQMEEEHQFQIMKLENQMDQIRRNSSTSQQQPLSSLVKEQIAEIQSLRAKLRDKNERVDRTRL